MGKQPINQEQDKRFRAEFEEVDAYVDKIMVAMVEQTGRELRYALRGIVRNIRDGGYNKGYHVGRNDSVRSEEVTLEVHPNLDSLKGLKGGDYS